MHSTTTETLIKLVAKFPTVGPRTATRFVFYLTKKPQAEINELIQGIKDLQEKTKTCSWCFKSFEGENELCTVCSDPRRDKTTLCIVEKEIDLEQIEKTHSYKGLYYIMDDIEQKMPALINRIQSDGIKEIIIALNSTPKGQNDILWLLRKLEPCKIKNTQLGRGLPMGSELEYADEETLSSAFKNRS